MGALAAGIATGGSLLSGVTGGKAAKKAAQIQADAYKQGIAEQGRQFDTTQGNIQPYVNAGDAATTGMLGLLGLNGSGAQSSAIDALKGSPLFTSQYNTGADTILQNAAATGGLRGGNTQNSLAQFGSGLLAQTIQQQLSNLGGLSSQGVSAANGLGGIGATTSGNISNLLGKAGGADATGIAGAAAGTQGTVNSLSSILQKYLAGNTGGGLAGGGYTSAPLGISAYSSPLNPTISLAGLTGAQGLKF